MANVWLNLLFASGKAFSHTAERTVLRMIDKTAEVQKELGVYYDRATSFTGPEENMLQVLHNRVEDYDVYAEDFESNADLNHLQPSFLYEETTLLQQKTGKDLHTSKKTLARQNVNNSGQEKIQSTEAPTARKKEKRAIQMKSSNLNDKAQEQPAKYNKIEKGRLLPAASETKIQSKFASKLVGGKRTDQTLCAHAIKKHGGMPQQNHLVIGSKKSLPKTEKVPSRKTNNNTVCVKKKSKQLDIKKKSLYVKDEKEVKLKSDPIVWNVQMVSKPKEVMQESRLGFNMYDNVHAKMKRESTASSINNNVLCVQAVRNHGALVQLHQQWSENFEKSLLSDSAKHINDKMNNKMMHSHAIKDPQQFADMNETVFRHQDKVLCLKNEHQLTSNDRKANSEKSRNTKEQQSRSIKESLCVQKSQLQDETGSEMYKQTPKHPEKLMDTNQLELDIIAKQNAKKIHDKSSSKVGHFQTLPDSHELNLNSQNIETPNNNIELDNNNLGRNESSKDLEKLTCIHQADLSEHLPEKPILSNQLKTETNSNIEHTQNTLTNLQKQSHSNKTELKNLSLQDEQKLEDPTSINVENTQTIKGSKKLSRKNQPEPDLLGESFNLPNEETSKGATSGTIGHTNILEDSLQLSNPNQPELDILEEKSTESKEEKMNYKPGIIVENTQTLKDSQYANHTPQPELDLLRENLNPPNKEELKGETQGDQFQVGDLGKNVTTLNEETLKDKMCINVENADTVSHSNQAKMNLSSNLTVSNEDNKTSINQTLKDFQNLNPRNQPELDLVGINVTSPSEKKIEDKTSIHIKHTQALSDSQTLNDSNQPELGLLGKTVPDKDTLKDETLKDSQTLSRSNQSNIDSSGRMMCVQCGNYFKPNTNALRFQSVQEVEKLIHSNQLKMNIHGKKLSSQNESNSNAISQNLPNEETSKGATGGNIGHTNILEDSLQLSNPNQPELDVLEEKSTELNEETVNYKPSIVVNSTQTLKDSQYLNHTNQPELDLLGKNLNTLNKEELKGETQSDLGKNLTTLNEETLKDKICINVENAETLSHSNQAKMNLSSNLTVSNEDNKTSINETLKDFQKLNHRNQPELDLVGINVTLPSEKKLEDKSSIYVNPTRALRDSQTLSDSSQPKLGLLGTIVQDKETLKDETLKDCQTPNRSNQPNIDSSGRMMCVQCGNYFKPNMNALRFHSVQEVEKLIHDNQLKMNIHGKKLSSQNESYSNAISQHTASIPAEATSEGLKSLDLNVYKKILDDKDSKELVRKTSSNVLGVEVETIHNILRQFDGGSSSNTTIEKNATVEREQLESRNSSHISNTPRINSSDAVVKLAQQCFEDVKSENDNVIKRINDSLIENQMQTQLQEQGIKDTGVAPKILIKEKATDFLDENTFLGRLNVKLNRPNITKKQELVIKYKSAVNNKIVIKEKGTDFLNENAFLGRLHIKLNNPNITKNKYLKPELVFRHLKQENTYFDNIEKQQFYDSEKRNEIWFKDRKHMNDLLKINMKAFNKLERDVTRTLLMRNSLETENVSLYGTKYNKLVTRKATDIMPPVYFNQYKPKVRKMERPCNSSKSTLLQSMIIKQTNTLQQSFSTANVNNTGLSNMITEQLKHMPNFPPSITRPKPTKLNATPVNTLQNRQLQGSDIRDASKKISDGSENKNSVSPSKSSLAPPEDDVTLERIRLNVQSVDKENTKQILNSSEESTSEKLKHLRMHKAVLQCPLTKAARRDGLKLDKQSVDPDDVKERTDILEINQKVFDGMEKQIKNIKIIDKSQNTPQEQTPTRKNFLESVLEKMKKP